MEFLPKTKIAGARSRKAGQEVTQSYLLAVSVLPAKLQAAVKERAAVMRKLDSITAAIEGELRAVGSRIAINGRRVLHDGDQLGVGWNYLPRDADGNYTAVSVFSQSPKAAAIKDAATLVEAA
jgi:hypothetical protein